MVDVAVSPEQPGPPGTVGGSFSTRRNSLNFLRLVLALTVVVAHAVGIGLFTSVFFLINFRNKDDLGTIAVYGFFAISGFLICRSAIRNNSVQFVWQRVLRIFPAYWVCLIVTALFLGVLGWLTAGYAPGVNRSLGAYFSAAGGPFSYIGRNAYLDTAQPSISGGPLNVPIQLAWNGSLWTLGYEFLCYLLVGFLALIGILRRSRLAVLGLLVLSWAALTIAVCVPHINDKFNTVSHFALMNLLTFVPIFLAGACLYLYRDRVPDSIWLCLLCAGAFVASVWIPVAGIHAPFRLTSMNLMGPFLAYPMIWLGIHLPFARVGAKNDYSYGVYIYAFTVTQLLVMWDLNRFGFLTFTALAILGTVPLAVASWWLVERHALRLKHVNVVQTVRSRVLTRAPARASPPSLPREATKSESQS